jgi:hypothetical protein
MSALKEHEQLALIGLLRFVVRLDGHTSPEELESLQSALRGLYMPQVDEPTTPYRVGAALPQSVEDQIAALEARADKKFFDDDSVRRAALTITRPEAREIIFAAVADLAASDGIALQEGWLLDWLADVWELEPVGADAVEK